MQPNVNNLFFIQVQFNKVDDSFSSNGATKVRCKNYDAKENVGNLLWGNRLFIFQVGKVVVITAWKLGEMNVFKKVTSV